jgi:hypothetical protein
VGLGLDGLDLVGQQNGTLVAFVLPVSIEDRPLHWTLVRSHTYYPEHILAYGSGKTCYSLVMGFGFFGPTVMVDYWVGGLSTTLRPGLQCWPSFLFFSPFSKDSLKYAPASKI